MKSLECATWVLTAFTGALMFATVIYAYLTYKILKSSKINQKLLEEQNNITLNQNNLLKEQMEISHNQATTLSELSSNLVRLTLAIGNLPYDAEGIKDRKERAKIEKK